MLSSSCPATVIHTLMTYCSELPMAEKVDSKNKPLEKFHGTLVLAGGTYILKCEPIRELLLGLPLGIPNEPLIPTVINTCTPLDPSSAPRN